MGGGGGGWNGGSRKLTWSRTHSCKWPDWDQLIPSPAVCRILMVPPRLGSVRGGLGFYKEIC